jgi:hypothetical protein
MRDHNVSSQVCGTQWQSGERATYLQQFKDLGLGHREELHVPRVPGGEEDEGAQERTDDVLVELLEVHVAVEEHEVSVQRARDSRVLVDNLVVLLVLAGLHRLVAPRLQHLVDGAVQQLPKLELTLLEDLEHRRRHLDVAQRSRNGIVLALGVGDHEGHVVLHPCGRAHHIEDDVHRTRVHSHRVLKALGEDVRNEMGHD